MMNPLPMMWGILLALVLTGTARGKDRISDVQFVAPAGWKLVAADESRRAFATQDSGPRGYTAITLWVSPLQDGDFRGIFDRAVEVAMGGRKRLNRSAARQFATNSGWPAVMETVSGEDSAGHPIYGQFVGIQLDRRAVVATLASTRSDALERNQEVFSRFLQDLELPSPSVSAGPQPAARAGVVSGNIYDAHGRPFRIPGAKVIVHIWGAGANGDRVGFNLAVDGNGHYESRVPHGLYGFHARAYLPLNGTTVCVDLEPLDGRPTEQPLDSTPGIVRDFALRLTGPMTGGNHATIQGYHGGSLTITDGANWKSPVFGSMLKRYPAGAKVVVTLVPIRPLIDGSQGQTVTLEASLDRMQSGDPKANVPLGAYRATARLDTPDGRRRPLAVALMPQMQYGTSVDVIYVANPEDHDGYPSRPNLMVID